MYVVTPVRRYRPGFGFRVPPQFRGLGAWLDANYCKQWYSLLDPVAWTTCTYSDWQSGQAQSSLANVYQTAKYGSIPSPDSLPAYPSPNAPQTLDQMTQPGAFTPDQSQVTPQQSAAWAAAIQAQLQAAQASGAWNPSGNFPGSGFNPFKNPDGSLNWPWIIGGGLVGFALVKAVAK